MESECHLSLQEAKERSRDATGVAPMRMPRRLRKRHHRLAQRHERVSPGCRVVDVLAHAPGRLPRKGRRHYCAAWAALSLAAAGMGFGWVGQTAEMPVRSSPPFWARNAVWRLLECDRRPPWQMPNTPRQIDRPSPTFDAESDQPR